MWRAALLVQLHGDRVWVEFAWITRWESTTIFLYRMQWAEGGRLAGGGYMRLGSCLRSGWSKGLVVVAAG